MHGRIRINDHQNLDHTINGAGIPINSVGVIEFDFDLTGEWYFSIEGYNGNGSLTVSKIWLAK